MIRKTTRPDDRGHHDATTIARAGRAALALAVTPVLRLVRVRAQPRDAQEQVAVGHVVLELERLAAQRAGGEGLERGDAVLVGGARSG